MVLKTRDSATTSKDREYLFRKFADEINESFDLFSSFQLSYFFKMEISETCIAPINIAVIKYCKYSLLIGPSNSVIVWFSTYISFQGGKAMKNSSYH